VRGDGTVGAPIRVCPGQTVLALRLSPDAASVLAVCGGATTGQLVVMTTAGTNMRTAPVGVVPRNDVAAWSPDGRSVALLSPGSCGASAPVCSVHVVLWDLVGGATRIIRPDEPLTGNVLWTSIGLSVSRPQPPDAGTLVWDGQSWRPFSPRRLTVADADRALLVEAGIGAAGGTAWERRAGQETRLTPSAGDVEYPLALAAPDRALVWREQGSAGSMIVYRAGQPERVVPGNGVCVSAQSFDGWLLCTVAGSVVQMYSLDANQFVYRSLSGLGSFTAIVALSR
jgi:hypothetical protein